MSARENYAKQMSSSAFGSDSDSTSRRVAKARPSAVGKESAPFSDMDSKHKMAAKAHPSAVGKESAPFSDIDSKHKVAAKARPSAVGKESAPPAQTLATRRPSRLLESNIMNEAPAPTNKKQKTSAMGLQSSGAKPAAAKAVVGKENGAGADHLGTGMRPKTPSKQAAKMKTRIGEEHVHLDAMMTSPKVHKLGADLRRR